MTESYTTNLFIRNSSLFTVLGVFGAISVYFTQLQIESKWRRLGIVSSLSIFFLVALAINRNFPPESSDSSPFDFAVNLLIRQRGMPLFYVAFWAMVLSVMAIVIQYSDTLLFLLQFLFFLLGFRFAKFLVDQLEFPDGDFEIGRDDGLVFYVAYVGRNSAYSAILGAGILALAWLQNLVPVNQLLEFRITSVLSAIVIGTSVGMVVGGLVFLVLVGSMMCTHILIKRIRARGQLEEVGKWMAKLTGNDIEGDKDSSSDG